MKADLDLPQAPDDAEELRAGARLCGGQFEIERRLGRGGVATVYRAVHAQTRSRVALKVLSQTRGDPQEQARLRNELAVGARLGPHPNLVQPLELGEIPELDGRLYLASELVAGPTLADLLMVRPLTVDRACRLIRDVATGLQHMHRSGIVHRDVKPSNIMVAAAGEPDERARLLDFGYAFALANANAPAAQRITLADERPGTKHYMAPEQILGMSPARGFDVYALAVTLYEALVGRPPLHADSAVAAARRKVDAEEPELSIRGLGHHIPDDLVELVDRCLRRNPAQRPADIDTFIHELDAALDAREHTVSIPAAQMAALLAPGAPEPAANESSPIAPPGEPVAPPGEPVAPPGEPAADPLATDPWEAPDSPPRRRWSLVAGAIVLAATAVLAGATLAKRPWEDGTEPAEDVATPAALATSGAGLGLSGGTGASPSVDTVAPPADVPAEEPQPGSPQTDVGPAVDEHSGAEPASTKADRKRRAPKRAPREAKNDPGPDCPAIRQRADRARASRSWSELAAATSRRNASCWPSRTAWKRDRVLALYKSGAYDSCIKTAGSSRDGEISTHAGLCKAKRDQ